MKKIIAIEIDDVLNNFSETLNNAGITYNPMLHSMKNPLFKKCIYNLESGELTDIGKNVMNSTEIVTGCAEFLDWLKFDGFRIILCTDRDLRFAYHITTNWLIKNKIQYDYLFNADNKLELCNQMQINYLINEKYIYSDTLNIYYPENPNKIKINLNLKNKTRSFHDFKEVKQWIQESYY